MSSLERKEMILAASLSVAQAAARLGVAGWRIDELRRAGSLFGVWHAKQGTFVFPDFQFDQRLDAETFRELLAIASRVGFDPAQSDRGGWGRAYWLYQPSELLSRQARADYTDALTDPVRVAMRVRNLSAEARTPVEALMDDPEGVLALARQLWPQQA
ncbi:hypothetical protein [Xanthomonas sp. NCPPB 2632]|uniref:hypothetical protein n=1 Tax=Xanthomonas sp. NCPPB 2632 TaxID=3240912 RepID=UPI0035117AF7